jgi:hypothetical protein
MVESRWGGRVIANILLVVTAVAGMVERTAVL